MADARVTAMVGSPADLIVVARSAAFFAGDVPGLPEVPPEFAGNDEAVARGMASMDSPFEPAQAADGCIIVLWI